MVSGYRVFGSGSGSIYLPGAATGRENRVAVAMAVWVAPMLCWAKGFRGCIGRNGTWRSASASEVRCWPTD